MLTRRTRSPLLRSQLSTADTWLAVAPNRCCTCAGDRNFW
jgi:hypothetical protein